MTEDQHVVKMTNPVKQRLPITLPLLKDLKQYLEMLSIPNQDKLMLMHLLLYSSVYLHSSEFVSPSAVAYDGSSTLLVKDIKLQNNAALISIKASKTDPFQQGVTLYLTVTGHPVCPVRVLRNYLPTVSIDRDHCFVLRMVNS